MDRSGNGKKVVVAMSGGVDSSVAALLLLKQGYDVVGCFMRLGSEDSVEAPEDGLSQHDAQDAHDAQDLQAQTCATSTNANSNTHSCKSSGGALGGTSSEKSGGGNRQGCCSVNDAADARLVAAMLDIPFYVVNFKKEFGRIVDYFVAEYNAGRTPNPCVRCNDWLKFGKLHAYARSIDADYIATGHYARVEESAGGASDQPAKLRRGLDGGKDQSYVLFGTPRDRLDEMLLPVGGYTKPAIRAMAEEFGLPVFDKPDSYEICFVPDNEYANLIDRKAPDAMQAGKIVDVDGQVVGTHEGHQRFTHGQRRGVGVALGYPIYVVDKDAATNTVTVGRKADGLADRLVAREINWLMDDGRAPVKPRACLVQIRYNSDAQPATIRATGEDELEVVFDQAQEAVTPGQAVVCYDGDVVLGGGWIERVGRVGGD